MNRLRAFGAFWWEFIVGDDWRIAAGVVAALTLTAAGSAAGLPAWWLMPVAVALILGLSLRRAARRAGLAEIHRSRHQDDPLRLV
jgi:hypothetical protein